MITSHVGTLEDETLARQVASETAAFTELYERYLKPVYGYIRTQVSDHTTAEDLTAQVFYKALVSASTYRGDGTYRAWIFQIARNTVASWRVDKAHAEIPVEALPDRADPHNSPVHMTVALEDRDLVLKTLAELPDAQREVVGLRYWRDLTVEEIATVTRRSSGAVKQLLHRARTKLRKRLSGKDLTALLGATGASALVGYSIHRHRKKA